jgi:hypothetical protein
MVIVLAALAAELDGGEEPAGTGEGLAFKGELPSGGRL